MHRVVIVHSVEKQLKKLPEQVASRIWTRLENLESDPCPSDVKKLKDHNAWRIRVGDYRIIYEIRDRELLIVVIKVGHRREVYR